MKLEKTKKNEAYLCGRLFAVLEKIQKEAKRSSNAFVSIFFTQASMIPNSIFWRLIRNGQSNLSKIGEKNKEFEINYTQTIQSITESITDFPKLLGPYEQVEFILGYYNQKRFSHSENIKDIGGNER